MGIYTKIFVMFLFLLLPYGVMGGMLVSQSTPNNNEYQLSCCTERGFESVDNGISTDGRFIYNACLRSEIELSEKTGAQVFSFNNLRLRKFVDLSLFFKNIMQSLSFREEVLMQEKSKLFYSSINHLAVPACQYYIFALRRIVI